MEGSTTIHEEVMDIPDEHTRIVLPPGKGSHFYSIGDTYMESNLKPYFEMVAEYSYLSVTGRGSNITLRPQHFDR